MNLPNTTGVCTGPNADVTQGCFTGTDFKGMAAGMWSTMPEWARVGVCVIIAAVLISAIIKLVSALLARAIGAVVVIAAVVLLHNKIPQAYDWFRHLPFVNGQL